MICLNRERDMASEEWSQITESLGLQEKLKNAACIVIKPNFAAFS